MIDDLLTEIAEAGWLVSNLYQLDSNLWRVNLRRPDIDGDYCTDWAEAPTLASALAECMDKLHEAEWFPERQTTVSAAPKPEAQSFLQALGFKPKAQPILRRL